MHQDESNTHFHSGPDCATPPLAQACRKLREEVIPIWLESNIFRLTDATEIRKWLPINIDTLSLMNSITLDLESSVMWYNTLKHYDVQPTRVLAYDDHMAVSEISVVWVSHARIIESLVMNPRKGALMAFSELAGLLDGRREGDKKRARHRFEKTLS